MLLVLFKYLKIH